MAESIDDSHVDDEVDEQIQSCLDLKNLQSFFLFAGAGSGKTRSLVSAIDFLRSKEDNKNANRDWLRNRGKKIAVITFTNAARDEILNRTLRDPIIIVHTIHSFSWLLIRNHQEDIRGWLKRDLQDSIQNLEADQAKRTRTDTKVYADTERSIASKKERLVEINDIAEFVYNPAGDNSSKDSLNHAEVIKIFSSLLQSKPTARRILVDSFPVLLIDESQDTNRHLLEALMGVQSQHPTVFALGLLGDTMQKIYPDGHPNLGKPDFIPETWAKPAKKMNHRSRSRIIELVNTIRSDVDAQQQQARTDKPGGFVRLFVVDREKHTDPLIVEHAVRQQMADMVGDASWATDTLEQSPGVKTLILEHHMAAARLGFEGVFEPLYQVSGESFRTSLMDGSLSGLRFFCVEVAELVEAVVQKNEFAIARIMQEKSPILDKKVLLSAGKNQREVLEEARSAVAKLRELIDKDPDPPLAELLNLSFTEKLFDIPRSLEPFVGQGIDASPVEGDGKDADPKSELVAWRKALEAPLSQATRYYAYVMGRTAFDTHQGVKGLEFPRVMVVVNDDEARGFLFSYDKLLGAKPKSPRDLDNEAAGVDSAVDRTRRLFYVTASRAEESLAVIVYSDNPGAVVQNAVEGQLFKENEIVSFD